jgi:NAD(P)-dependent dehydrogenase (short-subunit alcohol dehydrogenase family)
VVYEKVERHFNTRQVISMRDEKFRRHAGSTTRECLMSRREGQRGYQGKVAVVTGGGSGIGAALTHALTSAGAQVYCTDLDLAAAERVAKDAPGPGAAFARRVDVTDPDAVRAVVDEVVETAGRIDLMFNNAGIVLVGEVLDQSLAEWNTIIDVNIRGVVHGIAAAYPHMAKAGSGHIVNTASAAGLMASGMLTSYCATKHAVVGMSLGLRTEAKGHGIDVTVVCPSAVDTPILDKGAMAGFPGRDFILGAERAKHAYAPADLARDVLAGIARNRPIIVAPRRTKLAWLMSHTAPVAMNRMTTSFVSTQQTSGKN